MIDDFSEDRAPGTVVGSHTVDGVERLGVDLEGRLAVDNGALRMQPLARPGWGREGVAYGPYRREPGLALAVLALNGHNASQTYYFPEQLALRLRRWLGDARRGRFRRPHHHESFAVGWFPSAAPRDPTTGGNGFVMHSATADNGELWATVSGGPMPAVRGVQNLPILYVVVLRAKGAAYYASSTPGAFGLGDHPELRPLAIDVSDRTAELFAGIHQRILGEVGYRVDSRIEGVRIAQLPALARWFGTATLADPLTGQGPLAGSPAEQGGPWEVVGDLERTGDGLRAGPRGGRATVAPDDPIGLVHLRVTPGRHGRAGIVVRATTDDDGWSVLLGRRTIDLVVPGPGGPLTLARDGLPKAPRGAQRSVQVVDDGRQIGVYVDGRLAFGRRFSVPGHPEQAAAGLRASPGWDGRLVCFEAHPRAVPVPPELDLRPATMGRGAVVVADDHFGGPAGDLADRTPGSGSRWVRSEGDGVIERSGTGAARVRATVDEPNAGRTIYTVEWPTPGFAHLALELTHPGTDRGQGHAGRGGVVLWEDPDNYLVVNLWLDDVYDGASISSFYRLGGDEVMRDAVWTLVPGARFGGRNRLEVVFDGRRFLAWLDDRPSLYRALTDVYPDARPLEIRRVGVVANWEWGDDTGTVFHRFTGRRDPMPS